MSNDTVLPPGLPAPRPMRDALDAPYWEGTRDHVLRVQRCQACQGWQWGPEWICHRCHSFDVGWEEVAPEGVVYSWERPWHPVHRALVEACPYTILLVELPHAGGIRMIGNLVGDPLQPFAIGDRVTAVFEDHDEADTPFTLVQWVREA
ncbi:MAG: DNA-binding protein [Acidimicrobiia bacterium]|nr:DNA-binding protein [Acidimicrobiia bacterium]